MTDTTPNPSTPPTAQPVGVWQRFKRTFFPEYILRFELEQAKYRLEKVKGERDSIKYDYDKAIGDAWKANQELELEKRRSGLFSKQNENLQHLQKGYVAQHQQVLELNDNLIKQNQALQTEKDDIFERWQEAYTSLQDASNLQIEELHQEASTYRQRCLNLEQRLRDASTTKNLHQTLKSLERDRELSELLFPTDPDDFNYLAAAIKLYPPENDTALDNDLENAINDMLNHPEKSLRYQTATLQLAQKLQQQNFPDTAMSLYLLLFEHQRTEQTIHDKVTPQIRDTSTAALTLAQFYLHHNAEENAKDIFKAVLFYVKELTSKKQKIEIYSRIISIYPSILQTIRDDTRLAKDHFNLSFHLQFERNYHQKTNNQQQALLYAQQAYQLNPSEENKTTLQQIESLTQTPSHP